MDNIRLQITDTRSALAEALDAFDAEGFNEVPFAGSWTAGQVADHLLKAGGVTQVLYGRTAPAGRDPEQKMEMLRHVFLDFNTKMKSPDFIQPSDGPHDLDGYRRSLAGIWQSLEASAVELDLSVHCLDMELPVFGLLTRLEWIGFYAVHTQRHVHQLHGIYSALSKRPISQ